MSIVNLKSKIQGVLRQKMVSDVLWLGLSKICVIVTGLLGLRVLTELAPPNVFGEANLIVGLLGLGLQFCSSPFLQTLLRFYPKICLEGQESEFLRLIFKACMWASSFLILIALIAFQFGFLENIPSASYLLIFLIGGYLLGSVLKGMLVNVLNSHRMQKLYGMWFAAEAIITLILVSVFLLWKPTALSYIAGQAFAIIGIALLAIVIMKRRGVLPANTFFAPSSKVDTKLEKQNRDRLWKNIYTFGWPFVILTSAGWMTSTFDRYYLASQFDFYEAGKYVAVFSIANRLPTLPGGILNDAFRPVIYKAIADSDWVKWWRSFSTWIGMLLICGLTMVGFVHYFGGYLLNLLLAAEYRDGTEALMLFLTASFVVLTLAQSLETMVISFAPSSKLLLGKVVGALGMIALCFLWIPKFGLMGAAYASLGGHFILMLAMGVTLIFCLYQEKRNR